MQTINSQSARNTIRCILVAGLCFLVPLQRVEAEVVSIAGLSCAVDNRKEIDNKNSALTLRGVQKIIPTSEASKVILEYCLERQNQARISPRMLVDALSRMQASEEALLAPLLTRALFVHPKLSQELLSEYFNLVEQRSSYRRIFRDVLSEEGIFSEVSPPLVGVFLAMAAVMEPDWFVDVLKAPAITFSKEFSIAADDTIGFIVRSKKLDRLAHLAKGLRGVFGTEDPLVIKLQLLSDVVERFSAALQNNDQASIEISLLALQKYPEDKSRLYPVCVEEIHRVSRQRLDDKQVAQALSLLAVIDLQYRTPTTHALTKMCLERLHGKDLVLFDNTTIRRFVASLIQFDEPLKNVVEGAIANNFYQELAAFDLHSAQLSIERMVAMRPDPNLQNDALRIAYARLLRDVGYFEESERQLKRVATGVPWLVRFEGFILKIFGLTIVNLGLLLLSALLLIALITVRVLSRTEPEPKQAPVNPFKRMKGEIPDEPRVLDEEVEINIPAFRRMHKVSPEEMEYGRLLEVFSLSRSASFKEIRFAYRQAVKTYHPDRQGEEQGENAKANTKFVNLNQTYERILELRKSLGLDSD